MDSKLETNGSVPGENPVVPNAHPDIHREYGAKVEHESNQNRNGMIEKLFASYSAAKAQTKAQTSALHSSEWSNYESRSALMQKNAEHAPKTASLTDRVRALFGRR